MKTRKKFNKVIVSASMMFVNSASRSRSATMTARTATAVTSFSSVVDMHSVLFYLLRCRAVSTHFMTFSTYLHPPSTPMIYQSSATHPIRFCWDQKSIFNSRFFSKVTDGSTNSTASKPRKAKSQKTKTIIPRKAALKLTPKARNIFKKMIDITNSQGIILKYENSSQHALRMAFKFDLIKDLSKDLTPHDEGVSLEVLEDGITPKPPEESWGDNLPKLYIHHNAFMKVLGGTLDVDLDNETGSMTPLLFDRNGHAMDPNA